MIANQSLMNRGFQRSDLKAVMIPANEIAEALGDKRLTNMVMMGALLELLPVLTIEAVEKIAGSSPATAPPAPAAAQLQGLAGRGGLRSKCGESPRLRAVKPVTIA